MLFKIIVKISILNSPLKKYNLSVFFFFSEEKKHFNYTDSNTIVLFS